LRTAFEYLMRTCYRATDTQNVGMAFGTWHRFETNTRKIVQRLTAEGWISTGGGKHDKFVHPAMLDRVIVPRHQTQSIGVARVIAKTAGWI
jgi:predicted RNA binding protein YcfA (HicA-like mRNA interferase family)